MAVDDKEVEKFETEYKKKLFDEIQRICVNQSMVVQMIDRLKKETKLDIDFPNIGITLSNKLVQLQHEFKEAGISMYSKKIEDYGELNGIGRSLVGEAVILDLIAYTSKGIKNIIRYQETIDVIVEKKIKKIHKFKDRSQSTKFLDKMMNFFNPLKEEEVLYSPEEIQLIKQGILDCIASDKQLWNYNLKDNIVSSITKKIREEKYAAYVVPELLEESVIPDLQQLGLADLILELQRSLVEEYKKDLPASEIYQISENDMHLYVPDFNRETKRAETTMEELHKQVQMTIENGKTIETTQKSLRQEGITSEDFSAIDREVSALDRQRMTDMISKEQESEKNDEKIPTLREEEEQGEEGGNITI